MFPWFFVGIILLVQCLVKTENPGASPAQTIQLELCLDGINIFY